MCKFDAICKDTWKIEGFVSVLPLEKWFSVLNKNKCKEKKKINKQLVIVMKLIGTIQILGRFFFLCFFTRFVLCFCSLFRFHFCIFPFFFFFFFVLLLLWLNRHSSIYFNVFVFFFFYLSTVAHTTFDIVSHLHYGWAQAHLRSLMKTENSLNINGFITIDCKSCVALRYKSKSVEN